MINVCIHVSKHIQNMLHTLCVDMYLFYQRPGKNINYKKGGKVKR